MEQPQLTANLGKQKPQHSVHLPLHDTLLCCWEIFTLRYIVNPGWWRSWLDWKCSYSCNQSAQPTNPAQVTLTESTTYYHQFLGEHWTENNIFSFVKQTTTTTTKKNNNLRCLLEPNFSRILFVFKEHANLLKITLSETLCLLSYQISGGLCSAPLEVPGTVSLRAQKC